jgi:hypothetical protein
MQPFFILVDHRAGDDQEQQLNRAFVYTIMHIPKKNQNAANERFKDDGVAKAAGSRQPAAGS